MSDDVLVGNKVGRGVLITVGPCVETDSEGTDEGASVSSAVAVVGAVEGNGDLNMNVSNES
jgi:hypothetical protein